MGTLDDEGKLTNRCVLNLGFVDRIRKLPTGILHSNA